MSELAINGGAKVRTDPFPPWPHFFDDEIEEVQKVLREGRVNYWTGTRGREFQERFARFCGANHGIAVMNGTAALHVALAAAQIGPGDEVIVPPRTFIATTFSVLHQNAVPIDIEEQADIPNSPLEPTIVPIKTEPQGDIPVTEGPPYPFIHVKKEGENRAVHTETPPSGKIKRRNVKVQAKLPASRELWEKDPKTKTPAVNGILAGCCRGDLSPTAVNQNQVVLLITRFD